MNRLIILITTLLVLHPLPGRAAEPRVGGADLAGPGWNEAPKELTQLNREGAPLGMGAESIGTSLTLSGSTSNCSLNECPWGYALEVELRPVEEEFTGDPTHRSTSMTRDSKECDVVPYPQFNVAGLVNGTAYKWQAREKVVVYEASYVKEKLSCINPQTHYSTWEGYGEEGTPSFIIVPLVVRTTKTPTAVVKMEGSGSNGTANRLNLDDERYYRVWATVEQPYSTSWYAIFSGLDEDVRNLEINYKGFNSQRCDQRLDIWDWQLREWTGLDSQEVGEEETTIEGLVPLGDIPNYLSDSVTGELRVRVQCSSRSLSFSSNGNSLNISYDKPLSPR